MNFILEYWKDIQSGRCIVSERVKRQYAKLAEAIANPKGRFVFDEKRAQAPIEFVETFCKHSKGEWAGRPVALELFQKAFISALFGFVDKATGLRQYREALFYVARKNGKSTMLAGIALYMLIADGERGSEVYCAATKRDQARLIFDETHNMIKQNNGLSKWIRKRKNDLYFDRAFSKFQALSKDSGSMDGLNAHCVIIDELHGVKDRNLYEVLKQSQTARRQPLLIMITTAGTVRESIFDDIYSLACNIVDGVTEDETFLPILYELDKREEWTQPEAWQKANPALGTIKKLETLQDEVKRAKNSIADLKGLLVKQFNIRDTASSAWLSFEDIENPAIFDLQRFRNAFAVGGADLSRTNDLTCATLLVLDKQTKERLVVQMYWLPADNFEKRVKEEKIPYDTWLEMGLLRLCVGNMIDYRDITAWFVEMANKYQVIPEWIYYDSYSAAYWVQDMENNGFKMVKCYQRAKSLSIPMQTLGADLQAKRVIYNNNPLLRWCLSNTGIITDYNGNIKPDKSQAAKQKIDGMASLLDAYVGLCEHYNELLEA